MTSQIEHQPQLKQSAQVSQWHHPRSRMLSFLIISSSILAVGIVSVVSYSFVRNLILDTLKNKALMKVEQAGEEIDTWVSSRKSEVQTLANSYEVRSMRWEQAEPFLQLEQDRLPDYYMFILVNPNGSYYTTRAGFAKGKNLRDREYFRQAMQGQSQASDMVISKTTGKRQINISVPIWSFPPANYDKMPADRVKKRKESLTFYNIPANASDKPEVIGNLAGNIPVSQVTKVISETNLGENSYAFALDSKGVPIAHPDKQRLTGLESFLNSKNKDLALIAQAMVKQQQGVRLMQLDGRWVYVAYSPLNSGRWSVALVIPQENLEKQLDALNLLAIVVGVLLAIATLVALRQVRLLEQTRARAAEEAMMNRLTGRIRESLNLDTILQTTVDEFANLLQLDQVVFAWFEHQPPRFIPVCQHQSVDDRSIADLLDRLAAQLQPGDILRVNDAKTATHLSPDDRLAFLKQDIRGYLALPVKLPNATRSGYLLCLHSKPWIWGDREVELLSAVADQLAIAINQSRLYTQTQTQVELVSRQAEQLQQTSDRLQDALAYLTVIIDNLVDGLLVTDSNGTITRANPALNQMFGLHQVDLNQQDCRSVFSSDLVNLILESQQTPDAVFSTELPLVDGRIGKASVTGILKTAIAGETTRPDCIGTVVLVRDITAEKEIDKMKTDFISTVSHELRTPLTSVLGFAKIIQKKLDEVIFPSVATDDKKVQRTMRQVGENIEIIVSEGVRLTALINDVLDIAKMEAGKIEWRMEYLYMDAILDRAIAATAALFQSKNLLLVREIEPELPAILGDGDRLIQVVINLISNAVKFTDQGAVTCKVTRDGDVLTVSVIDTGAGIALQDQDKVFEKFKQVGDTLTDKPQGTGLGLPICKQIVEHHGGKIWVESTIGMGSTFSFTLPVRAADVSHIHKIDFQTLLQQLQAPISTTLPSSDFSSKTVLVVDDEAHIRNLLRQHLEAEGYQVLEAVDGRDAIAQVKQHKPHLVILDLMMPNMNGFDAAAILKNDPQTMGIPIIILSIIGDHERANRLGDRALTKPINAEHLLREVNTVIAQGFSRRRVLIVDEDEWAGRTLVQVLQAKGFTVEEASDDAELLEKALKTQPDLVIANAQFWENSKAVKTLKFQKGLENLLFLLVSPHERIE